MVMGSLSQMQYVRVGPMSEPDGRLKSPKRISAQYIHELMFAASVSHVLFYLHDSQRADHFNMKPLL